MAQIRFYDLELNIREKIWSPNTSKTRYALNIKKIPYETKWVNFSNLHSIIPAITKSNKRPTVPVIVDLIHDGKVVQDSWAIAVYLEKTFPNAPSLFHGNIGLHKFFYDYATKNIPLIISRFVILDVASNCGSPETQAWFRQNREQRFGTTLEEFHGDTSKNIADLKQALVPIHQVLKDYPFLTGDKVGFADVALASYLTMLYSLQPDMFEKAVLSTFDDDQVMHSWWNRMEPYRLGNHNPSSSRL